MVSVFLKTFVFLLPRDGKRFSWRKGGGAYRVRLIGVNGLIVHVLEPVKCLFVFGYRNRDCKL